MQRFASTGEHVTAAKNSSARWATRSLTCAASTTRMFVDSVAAESADYRAFWAKLGRGE
jgi:hypothetical protein